MPVLDPNVKFQKSGGSTNEDPNASLGGQISTATARNFVSNVLHETFDEVQKSEAVGGEYEYRHAYYRNSHAVKVRNAKLVVVADTSSIWSKVEFAKGTASNGKVEQSIPNENTAPVGISDTSWKIPSDQNPLLLGDVEAGSTASFWMRRKIEPGSLISRFEKIHVRIKAGLPVPVAPPLNCPDGQHYNPDTALCEADTIVCPPGTVLSTDGQQCVPVGTPPTAEPVTIAAVGDIGCSSNAENVVRHVGDLYEAAKAANKGFLFITNGDLSYFNTITCFVAIIEENNLKDVTKISIGDYDDDENSVTTITRQLKSYFGTPSVGYYSFEMQNIHVLIMDTQASYISGSLQHTFAINDLKQASENNLIDWIIVSYHKASLTAETSNPPLTDFRDLYHPIFDQYKVDIVIQSHNHNMQRSYPIKHNASSPTNPIVIAGPTAYNIYTNVDGRIFVVCGTGGDGLHHITEVNHTIWEFTEDDVFGFFSMEWSNNNKKLTAKMNVPTAPGITETIDSFECNKTN